MFIIADYCSEQILGIPYSVLLEKTIVVRLGLHLFSFAYFYHTSTIYKKELRKNYFL
jgi:hypothetical protein